MPYAAEQRFLVEKVALQPPPKIASLESAVTPAASPILYIVRKRQRHEE